jgi:type I restriction enzyme R subunit
VKPEEEAREHIDDLLVAAGWVIQDYKALNLGEALGVAVREFPLESGEADYLLFVNRKAVGVLEAKPVGTTLSGVAEQTAKYTAGLPAHVQRDHDPAPFAYESTGVETYFRDLRDPQPRSRRLFAFHKPETLMEWVSEDLTLRSRLMRLPPLVEEGLRGCQVKAIQSLELSLSEARPRALVQMASGSGKTFMAVTLAYRLIKFAGGRRILFLVDRNTLARQTRREFQQYETPDDERKFTELYNIQHLTSNVLDPVSRVCITTIQRLYSMLCGEPDFDPEVEEESHFEMEAPVQEPREVSYNPAIPIETFDFIVTDECHRSIYNLWRQVLEYFDAFTVGLTATPSRQTLGFFNQNLVMEYGHDHAVADGINVGYDVYSIETKITRKGGKVKAGYYVDKRDKLTRKVRWEQLDHDLEYAPIQLDRDVVATDQIRTVIRTFKQKLFTEIFPGRKKVPKTLIFAKDDSHAEDIVAVVREEFGRGNDFCKKITYKTTGEKTEDLIASFRNSYYPRIAVTVDMISTGTDIRPLECLLFMRDVKSRVYFEQMKGRGTRVVSPTDLASVTPDASSKTHFVIVDAVGVCQTDKTDSRPLERKRTVSFDNLILTVAKGARDTDTLTSLAGRLARLDREIDEKERAEIESTVAGQTLKTVTNGLLDALDPDKHIESARQKFEVTEPTKQQIGKVARDLLEAACRPFDNPDFRSALIEIRRRKEQTIDTVSRDKVLYAGSDADAKERASQITGAFRDFIEANRDELTALQIIYEKPYGKRHMTFEAIRELADAIDRPPRHFTPDLLWKAYERLDTSKVRGAGPQRLLADIISLVRFAIGRSEVLEPFSEGVERRFEAWLAGQARSGHGFSGEQIAWLRMIKDHVATSLSIDKDDLELAPFYEKGGAHRAHSLFGERLDSLLEELSEVLVA